MAKFDQGGGCACGLQKECDCSLGKPGPLTTPVATSQGAAPALTGKLVGQDGKPMVTVDAAIVAVTETMEELSEFSLGSPWTRERFLAALRRRLEA